MNKNRLTTLALVALIILNAVFAGLVYSNYRKNNYYSDGNISDLCEVLAESNIILDKDIFPKKKVVLPAYEVSFTDKELTDAVKLFTGADAVYGEDGITAKTAGGTYIFKKDFSFVYTANDYVPAEHGEARELGSVSPAAAVAFVKDYREDQASRGQKTPEFTYETENSAVYENGVVRVVVREYADGTATNNYYEAIIENGELMYASGRITLVSPSKEYTAKCFDLTSILIKEKQYFKSYGGGRKFTVLSINYVYDVCFGVVGTAYLIPSCEIVYENGLSHTYDLVSGELIYQ